MPVSQSRSRGFGAVALMAACVLPPLAHAQRSVAEHLAADPRASIEIHNVAGSINLLGWDKPLVEVTGTAGSDVERVEVTGDPGHVVVQVVSRQNRLWGANGSADLVVHVPARSAVTATLVSAGFKVGGLLGDLHLQSVSGDVKGEVGGNLQAGSVSGDIHLDAKSAKSLTVKTVSGDITLTGGSGESDVTTVSGTIKLQEGTQTRAHFKSVSGDVSATLGMSADAQVDAQSVSGDITLRFPDIPTADFDVQTISGEIESCFGPKPESRPGSGSRLEYKNGASVGRIQVAAKSGNISLCTDQGRAAKPSA